MKEIVIAFDVDGTILNNEGIPPETPIHQRGRCPLNVEIVMLMQLLSKYMKNTRIIVWSGGGKEYAERIVREYGLEKYVDKCFAKADYLADVKDDGAVDIAFDDIHSFALAEKNLIVRMK